MTQSKNERRRDRSARLNRADAQRGVSLSPESPPIEIPTKSPGISPARRWYGGRNNNTAGVLTAFGDFDVPRSAAEGAGACSTRGATSPTNVGLEGTDDVTNKRLMADVPSHGHALAETTPMKASKACQASQSSRVNKDGKPVKTSQAGQTSQAIKVSQTVVYGEEAKEEEDERQEEEKAEEEEEQEEQEGEKAEKEQKVTNATVKGGVNGRRIGGQRVGKNAIQNNAGNKHRAVPEGDLNERLGARERDGGGDHWVVTDLAPKVLLAREVEAARRREERATAARKEEEEQLRQATAFRAKEVWVDLWLLLLSLLLRSILAYHIFQVFQAGSNTQTNGGNIVANQKIGCISHPISRLLATAPGDGVAAGYLCLDQKLSASAFLSPDS